MIWICIAVGILFAIGYFYVSDKVSSSKEKKREKFYESLEQKLISLSDFTPSKQFVGPHRNFIFAIDFDKRKIGYVDVLGAKAISFDEIKKVEIFKNRIELSEKQMSDIVKRTMLGGALLGVSGAIIGGMSAKSVSTAIPSSVSVKIECNSISHPSITIDCFDKSLCVGSQDNEEWHDGSSIAETITICIQDIIDTNGNNTRKMIRNADEEIMNLFLSGQEFLAKMRYVEIYGLDKVGIDLFFGNTNNTILEKNR